MENYAMIYEEVVLGAWDRQWRREDPDQLGDADVFSSADNDLSGQNGENLKHGLLTALRVTAGKNKSNSGVYNKLLELDDQVGDAKSIDDICKVLDATKVLFKSIGITITH